MTESQPVAPMLPSYRNWFYINLTFSFFLFVLGSCFLDEQGLTAFDLEDDRSDVFELAESYLLL